MAKGRYLEDLWRPFQLANSKQELIRDTNYIIKHTGVKGYQKTSMQNEKTEEPGYRMEELLRSLVTPLLWGRRMLVGSPPNSRLKSFNLLCSRSRSRSRSRSSGLGVGLAALAAGAELLGADAAGARCTGGAAIGGCSSWTGGRR